MLNLKQIIFLISVVMILWSCTDDQMVEPELQIDESEISDSGYNFFDPETLQVLHFNNTEDLLVHIKETPYYESVKSKLDFIKKERVIIESLGLYDLEEDDNRLISYANEFELRVMSNPSFRTAVAAGGRLYRDRNAGRKLYDINVPKLRMKRSKRNKASSVKGGALPGTLVLCNKTYFRGTHWIVPVIPAVTINFGPNLDNKAESFY